MAPTFKDVYDEKYLLLTTFTKDGKPKPMVAVSATITAISTTA